MLKDQLNQEYKRKGEPLTKSFTLPVIPTRASNQTGGEYMANFSQELRRDHMRNHNQEPRVSYLRRKSIVSISKADELPFIIKK